MEGEFKGVPSGVGRSLRKAVDPIHSRWQHNAKQKEFFLRPKSAMPLLINRGAPTRKCRPCSPAHPRAETCGNTSR
jgi:hypothetical protein